jgi:hypothetical protein
VNDTHDEVLPDIPACRMQTSFDVEQSSFSGWETIGRILRKSCACFWKISPRSRAICGN